MVDYYSRSYQIQAGLKRPEDPTQTVLGGLTIKRENFSGTVTQANFSNFNTFYGQLEDHMLYVVPMGGNKTGMAIGYKSSALYGSFLILREDEFLKYDMLSGTATLKPISY